MNIKLNKNNDVKEYKVNALAVMVLDDFISRLNIY